MIVIITIILCCYYYMTATRCSDQLKDWQENEENESLIDVLKREIKINYWLFVLFGSISIVIIIYLSLKYV